jgi:type IX secretion system PorP/SprF family membrane protein
MKHLIIGIYLIIAWNLPANAQSNGMISQYMFNRLLINPAYAGNNESLTLGFLHKDQWTGVDGAPSTQIFSGHSPANNRIGLGLTLVNDKMGGLNQKGLYGAYAYRIKSPDYVLSFGLQAGLTSYKYRHLFLRDENDPVFVIGNTGLTEPNFGTGVYYEDNKWYLGFSVPQLIKFGKNEAIAWSLQRRSYIFQGGYSMYLSDALTLNPSALIYIKENSKPEINLNTNILIENLIWIGAIFRNLDNLGFVGKVQINRQLQVGYGYDANTGGLSALSTGSHEIMIQYSFTYVEKNIISPKFF